jgi:hypothetical protein
MKLKFSPSKSIMAHSVQNTTIHRHFIRSVSAMPTGLLVCLDKQSLDYKRFCPLSNMKALSDGELLEQILHHMKQAVSANDTFTETFLK